MELSELFEKISEFSMDHKNIRYKAVSYVLDLLPRLMGLRSPLYNKIFKWHIRNFYGLRKTNGLSSVIYYDNESYVKCCFGAV